MKKLLLILLTFLLAAGCFSTVVTHLNVNVKLERAPVLPPQYMLKGADPNLIKNQYCVKIPLIKRELGLSLHKGGECEGKAILNFPKR